MAWNRRVMLRGVSGHFLRVSSWGAGRAYSKPLLPGVVQDAAPECLSPGPYVDNNKLQMNIKDKLEEGCVENAQ